MFPLHLHDFLGSQSSNESVDWCQVTTGYESQIPYHSIVQLLQLSDLIQLHHQGQQQLSI